MKLDKLQLIIVTGLSGAGKTQAIRCLEDLSFFCIDNLPPSLVPKLLEELEKAESIDKVALVMDIRGGKFFDSLDKALACLDKRGLKYRTLFLDASNEVLIRRFKETRRAHPLSPVDIMEGIIQERKILAHLKSRAEIILDTSDMSTNQLKGQISNIFSGEMDKLPVTVMSFGFKYGIPMDADLVVDVRFIPNPHYDMGLRPLSGHDEKVKEYVIKNEVTQEFLQKYCSLLHFLIPHYKKEGKSQLVIAIGCTGGRHRSVAIANHLSLCFNDFDCRVITKHRDLDKGSGGI
ncbi:RNase adapter RapZ [Desulfitibacter alkalitolerans]|uniref:RNase adapter RapZ n=1 Tax=Desulfitibacter alkalitolerans TaxID=264641 RepID=UPI000A4F7F26|nr:RNase adapter RapZ [Desulfitibacter alkalitolerans]